MAVIYQRDQGSPAPRRRADEPVHRRLIPRLFRLIAVLSSPEWPSIAEIAEQLDVGERTIKRDIAFLRSIGLTIARSRRQGGLHLDLPASAATDVGQALYNMAATLAAAREAAPAPDDATAE